MKKLTCLTLLLAALFWAASLHSEENPATRTVIVTFDKPDDGPPLSGGLVIAYLVDSGTQKKPLIRVVPVQDDKCVFEVPSNIYLHISPEKLTGYYFKTLKNYPVAANSKPLKIELDLTLAGSISGKALDAQGQPVNTPIAQVIIFTDNKFIQDYYVPIKDGNFTVNTIPQDGLNMVFLGPIPIPTGDTDYRVVLNNNGNLIISKPVTINKKNPTCHVDLQFKPGKRIYGMLRDERKKPIVGEQLWLQFKLGSIFMTAKKLPGLKTSSDGSFEIPAVNFDAGGIFSGYRIVLPESKKYENQVVNVEDDTDLPLIITAEDQ